MTTITGTNTKVDQIIFVVPPHSYQVRTWYVTSVLLCKVAAVIAAFHFVIKFW